MSNIKCPICGTEKVGATGLKDLMDKRIDLLQLERFFLICENGHLFNYEKSENRSEKESNS